MRRRELIAVLGLPALWWPLQASGQQPAIPVIGYLSSNTPETPVGEVAAFREGLAEAGFAEGRNVAIEYRFAEGNYERLPGFAAELVEHRVNVIAASGLPAVLAAKSASSKIPIVFTIGVDPVAYGLVASLKQPGGNLTGVTQITLALGEKQLQLLHELVPGAGSVGFLVNPKNPNSVEAKQYVEAAARILGLHVLVLPASNMDEIEAAFSAARERRVKALLVGGDNVARAQAKHLVRMAADQRIATMYNDRDYIAEGGLISYHTVARELRRQAGVYVGRILNGTKPAELPVVQPTRFELVINLKTAKALGLTVPPALLARADEVIEREAAIHPSPRLEFTRPDPSPQCGRGRDPRRRRGRVRVAAQYGLELSPGLGASRISATAAAAPIVRKRVSPPTVTKVKPIAIAFLA